MNILMTYDKQKSFQEQYEQGEYWFNLNGLEYLDMERTSTKA